MLLIIAIIGVINYIVGGTGMFNFRVDVTEDRLYTLSSGTKNILSRIPEDKPVIVRFYTTTEERVMPPVLTTYARNALDLLFEFQKASGDNLILERLSPNPDTDDEDKAREDQIQGMQVNADGDNIYLGLAIQSGTQKEVIAFLNPQEETKLEYDIARAINKVISTKKTIIGVMSPMPVMGSPMYQFQRQPGQAPWAVVQQLKLDYEVRDVSMSANSIDKDISVLILLHPGDIAPSTEYAIDQFLLRGGRVLAAVDPLCWIGQNYNGQQNPMTGQSTFVAQSSDLPTLLKAWGVGYNPGQVVADMHYRGVFFQRQNATVLQLPAAAISKDNPITEGLQTVLMPSAGSFSVPTLDRMEAQVLLESSEQSSTIDLATAESLRTEPLRDFSPSGTRKALALRLSGKFKTAFPDGPPAAPVPAEEGGGAEQDGNAPATADSSADTEATVADVQEAAVAPAGETGEAAAAAPAKPSLPADHLAESAGNESAVILFADADMFYDAFSLQQDQMTGGMIAINSNVPMFLNAVELLSGGGDLLAVRSRASTQRPFLKLDEMREKVETEYRPKMQALENQLNGIAEQIGTLRLKTDAKTRTLILDPEQEKQMTELMATQAKISKEVREVRKQQNREIDYIKFTLKLLNIIFMPLLVVTVGLVLALRRRSATAAR
jgi:ABC-type uncharacterized transport system involved in gliding motility auxiliary subunit